MGVEISPRIEDNQAVVGVVTENRVNVLPRKRATKDRLPNIGIGVGLQNQFNAGSIPVAISTF